MEKRIRSACIVPIIRRMEDAVWGQKMCECVTRCFCRHFLCTLDDTGMQNSGRVSKRERKQILKRFAADAAGKKPDFAAFQNCKRRCNKRLPSAIPMGHTESRPLVLTTQADSGFRPVPQRAFCIIFWNFRSGRTDPKTIRLPL